MTERVYLCKQCEAPFGTPAELRDHQAQHERLDTVGSSRVDLQACKLEYSIVSPK